MICTSCAGKPCLVQPGWMVKYKFEKLNGGQIVEDLSCQTRNFNCILKPKAVLTFFFFFEENHDIFNLLGLS